MPSLGGRDVKHKDEMWLSALMYPEAEFGCSKSSSILHKKPWRIELSLRRLLEEAWTVPKIQIVLKCDLTKKNFCKYFFFFLWIRCLNISCGCTVSIYRECKVNSFDLLVCVINGDREWTRWIEDEGNSAGGVLFTGLRAVSERRRERHPHAAPGLVRVVRPRPSRRSRRYGHWLSGGGEEAHTEQTADETET